MKAIKKKLSTSEWDKLDTWIDNKINKINKKLKSPYQIEVMWNVYNAAIIIDDGGYTYLDNRLVNYGDDFKKEVNEILKIYIKHLERKQAFKNDKLK